MKKESLRHLLPLLLFIIVTSLIIIPGFKEPSSHSEKQYIISANLNLTVSDDFAYDPAKSGRDSKNPYVLLIMFQFNGTIYSGAILDAPSYVQNNSKETTFASYGMLIFFELKEGNILLLVAKFSHEVPFIPISNDWGAMNYTVLDEEVFS